MSDVITTDQPASATSLLQAKGIANLVERALLTEVRLTPKPGLVDIRNSGAHKDMDLALFEKSTVAVAPWMENFYQFGYDTSALEAELVLPMLRPIGMACEADMLQATGGVNTHRGAVFSFGLISAVTGRMVALEEELEQNRICYWVARMCRDLVAKELSSEATNAATSKSVEHFLHYGLSGARGEAESGFQTVRTVALPIFERIRAQNEDMNLALLQTLLHLMAWNNDTNLVSRGALKGLYYVQQQAQKMLWEGGVLMRGGLEALQAFDDELIARNLSPGGSADLLAVTWFLSHFPKGETFAD